MTAREEEVAVVEEHDPELARLQHEIDMLTRGGIIEVAVRNPNVADYMKHWEARAEKAEAERDKLREALEPFGDIDGEGDEDFADDTLVIISFGRSTVHTVRLGHLRNARRALSLKETAP